VTLAIEPLMDLKRHSHSDFGRKEGYGRLWSNSSGRPSHLAQDRVTPAQRRFPWPHALVCHRCQTSNERVLNNAAPPQAVVGQQSYQALPVVGLSCYSTVSNEAFGITGNDGRIDTPGETQYATAASFSEQY
jgi:hypothetical protein